VFIAEGRVLQSMDMSLVGPGHKLKLYRVPVSMIGMELSEAVRGIWPRL
jgi:hypothetical protein